MATHTARSKQKVKMDEGSRRNVLQLVLAVLLDELADDSELTMMMLMTH